MPQVRGQYETFCHWGKIGHEQLEELGGSHARSNYQTYPHGGGAEGLATGIASFKKWCVAMFFSSSSRLPADKNTNVSCDAKSLACVDPPRALWRRAHRYSKKVGDQEWDVRHAFRQVPGMYNFAELSGVNPDAPRGGARIDACLQYLQPRPQLLVDVFVVEPPLAEHVPVVTRARPQLREDVLLA